MKNNLWKVLERNDSITMMDGSASKEYLENLGFTVLEQGLPREAALASVDSYRMSPNVVKRIEKPTIETYQFLDLSDEVASSFVRFGANLKE